VVAGEIVVRSCPQRWAPEGPHYSGLLRHFNETEQSLLSAWEIARAVVLEMLFISNSLSPVLMPLTPCP
jgi:hypothetical protein